MHALQETIRPSADLRNHYSEISKQCREENEAVIITVNGRGDTVSLSYEEYKRAIRELLEIPVQETIVSVIGVGYPNIEPSMPKRKTIEEVSTFY